MKQYKYIFWDLDGTLVNTYEGIMKSIQYALEPYGIQIEGTENLRRFIGPPLRVSFPQFAGLPEEYVEEAILRYRDRYHPIGLFESAPFPEVRETLEFFKKAGKIQVVSSSKPEEMCKRLLKANEMDELFDEIVGASLDGRIDSKIEVLNEAFCRLQAADPDFSKEKVVLIGDTKFDAAGAKEAGIDCIGVSYGFGSREELLEHGALQVYDDLESLKKDFLL